MLRAATLSFGLLCASAAVSAPRSKAPAPAPEPPAPSEALAAMADWIIATADNRGLPFAVIDKTTAQVFVFEPEGKLKGGTPALLGVAFGDHSTPGVGDRELSDIPPEDRTTPAGRFLAAYGPAAKGKTVLWVDYATAISLHPVINTNKKEQRPKRLASPEPDDNRITFGCINVPSAFYKKVVRPTFSESEGVVYVLPELGPVQAAFPAFEPRPGPYTYALREAASRQLAEIGTATMETAGLP